MPGISYAFAQPIDMRVQEMIIGARGDVVLKVFGDDIDELNRIAAEAAARIRALPGAADVFAMRNGGMKYLTVSIDRLKAGRLGLNATEVQEAIRVWVDGRRLGIVLEGTVRTPLVLRGEQALRESAADLERVQLVTPTGGTVELGQVAEIRLEDGPIQVTREQGQRFATVLANVRGRDLVSFVADAEAAVASSVRIPAAYTLDWGGQFENQQRASARLAIVVPIALGVIFLLLYMTFGSLRQALLVFCIVPFASIGGIVALWASGEFLSVPASVGFIALIGIAVLNGVVLVSYINEVVARGTLTFRDSVLEGARRRLRPVALTATIAALGLVPFLFATGPGAEIQRPLAIVVIGGLFTATLLTLVLLPILYERFGCAPAEKAAHDARLAAPDSVTDVAAATSAKAASVRARHRRSCRPCPRRSLRRRNRCRPTGRASRTNRGNSRRLTGRRDVDRTREGRGEVAAMPPIRRKTSALAIPGIVERVRFGDRAPRWRRGRLIRAESLSSCLNCPRSRLSAAASSPSWKGRGS